VKGQGSSLALGRKNVAVGANYIAGAGAHVVFPAAGEFEVTYDTGNVASELFENSSKLDYSDNLYSPA